MDSTGRAFLLALALCAAPAFGQDSLQDLARELQLTPGPLDSVERSASLLPKELGLKPAGRLALACELLRSGRTADALVRLAKLAPEPAALMPLAIAHLRLGEEQNCLAHHSSDACLYPIQGAGVHTAQAGSRTASQHLRAILELEPGSWPARWLLNLAAMTLGEYPAAVPEALRVPLPPEAPWGPGRFVDAAARLGLAEQGHAGSVVMDDLDGDGDLDLLVSSNPLLAQTRLLRNDGGKFTDATSGSGLEELGGFFNLAQADYDNDGDVDVIGLRGGWRFRWGHFPLALMRNEGGGKFAEVSAAAGIAGRFPTQTAAWGDFDGDGWLDLYIGAESGCPEHPHPSRLYRNDRKGSFTPLPPDAGAEVTAMVKGAVWGDADGDGRPDLLLSIFGEPNRLLRNEGPDATGRWRFRDVSARAGIARPVYSFPACFFDYDNDGDLDAFIEGYGPRVEPPAPIRTIELAGQMMSTISESSPACGEVAKSLAGVATAWDPGRLYRNKGDGTFDDVTQTHGLAQVRLGMSLNFGDLDGDGYPDLYFGTGAPSFSTLVPNRLYRNDSGRRFVEVTVPAGVGHLQKGHGIAMGDIDRNGGLDIFVKMGGMLPADVARPALYLNPGTGKHWVRLKLRGTRSNRSAIGARIRVRAGGRDIFATVGSGGSFGASPLEQFIGLGDAAVLEEVEILWPGPGRRKQILRNVPADRELAIVEE